MPWSESSCSETLPDEEKKKYFKIQANHEAPGGARYTRDDVKRRKLDHDEAQRTANLNERQAKERVTRSHLLMNPVNRVLEEIGAFAYMPSEMRSRRGLAVALEMSHKTLTNFEYPAPHTVLDVHRDPRYGGIVEVANYASGNEISMCLPVEDEEEHRWHYLSDMHSLPFPPSAMQASCSAMSPTGCFLVGLHEPNDSQICILQLPDPDEDGHYHRPEIPEPEAILLGGTIPRVATPLSSATVPTFALGLQKGLFLLKLSPDGGEDDLYRLGTMPERASRSSRSSPSAADDVWAADFLTPNTVVAGGRGKFVFVADSRVEAEGALACEHGALITDIKAIDDYRILVGGGSRAPGGNENGEVVEYDLRFKRQENGRAVSTRNFPGLTFASPWPKFDLCTELGLMAAVNRERRPYFMSLRNGQIVEPPLGVVWEFEKACKVKFDHGPCHDTPQWGGPRSHSLLVSTTGAVHELS
ncbi:unnamed protein product [Penicillium bialowiezense]